MSTDTKEETYEQKAKRFKEGFAELYDATQNLHLERALVHMGPLSIWHVVDGLESLTSPTFTLDEAKKIVEVIKTGGSESDIPSYLADRIYNADMAKRLLGLYAELLGLRTYRKQDGEPYFLWSEGPALDPTGL